MTVFELQMYKIFQPNKLKLSKALFTVNVIWSNIGPSTLYLKGRNRKYHPSYSGAPAYNLLTCNTLPTATCWFQWYESFLKLTTLICEMNFHRFFPKSLWVKKEKSMKMSSPTFFEFIGFMVFKTTVLISRLTSF